MTFITRPSGQLPHRLALMFVMLRLLRTGREGCLCNPLQRPWRPAGAGFTSGQWQISGGHTDGWKTLIAQRKCCSVHSFIRIKQGLHLLRFIGVREIIFKFLFHRRKIGCGCSEFSS